MLKVYDHNESVCCQKVRLALAEKAVPFENVHVAISEGDQFSNEFLALNPKAVVPVAVHNGRVVTESTIINEYINEAFDGPELMPTDPYWRSRKRAWSLLLDTSVHAPHTTALSFVVALRFVFQQSLNTKEKLETHLQSIISPISRDIQREAFELGYKSPKFTEAVMAFDAMLKAMEQQLQETSWLAGNSLSLADLDIAPYVHRLESLQLSQMWSSYPKVEDWYQRITSRESWSVAITQQHIDQWVSLMTDTGANAWPEVERILSAGD
jgi:glutathione S-transferase